MQRSSIIATVVATGGVLIAGSVASVAVINAASSSVPQSQTVALVSDQATGVASTSSATPVPVVTTPVSSTAAPTAPSLEPQALPAIPKVSNQPVTAAAANPAPQAPAPRPTATHTQRPQGDDDRQERPRKPKSTPSASASASQAASRQETVSADQARELVLAAIGGGVTKSVEKEDHQGYAAWAVKVLRHDGSTVTGYVDRFEGVVFDWVVNEPAPTPTQSSGNSGSGGSHDDDDDHEDDDHEDDDHHEDEGDDD